ncbi:Fe(2+) transporter [Dimargaris cristalligena]|uniref:Putative mitochondrial RNA splicing protein n=1 Tax=Dimargaris cristalligena TaxID=215637 RepID=A0A4P9ZWI7_9FUNG|nr:Fe(2+) transporter [Dimargaris cristalligena]RKP37973.1 putative mitochondrial RNA splicing protein [Dimargaris cristalligena]|eukprot:RKP37973.1 putative mitochondrial RNA splicing protein [Dimargaris cristalligena]
MCDHVHDHDYETLPENSPLVIHLVAGAMAGIVEHSVMYPFDSIKTRMQVIQPSPQAVYSGVVQAVSHIGHTEGLKTLWRGVNSVILGAGPSHALYFATYEYIKDLVGGNSDQGSHPLASGLGGACATVVSDALMNPFDVIKQRMQVHGSTHRNILECALQVFRREGLAAFYVSYPTTLAMTIPFQSIQFAAYESCRKFLNPDGHYDPKTHIIAGAAAGALAAAATTPLDVMRTLLQTRGHATDPRIIGARGIGDAFRIIYERKGLAGFWKGIQPRIISHVPSTALSWVTYEYFKWVIGKNRSDPPAS